MALKDRSLMSFWTSVWNSLSILLSDFISMPINSMVERQLTTGWILASVLLLSIFSGELYENMVKEKPNNKIEKFDELLSKPEWSESKIYCVFGFQVFDKIYFGSGADTLDNNKYAPLISRTNPLIMFDMLDLMVRKQIISDIMNKNYVYSDPRLATILILNTIRSESNYEEGVDYYVSEKESYEPFYIVSVNEEFTQILMNKLNTMYGKMIF